LRGWGRASIDERDRVFTCAIKQRSKIEDGPKLLHSALDACSSPPKVARIGTSPAPTHTLDPRRRQ
jgi:hypothetical protein